MSNSHDAPNGSAGEAPRGARDGLGVRLLVLAGVVAAVAGVYLYLGPLLSLETLARREAELHALQGRYPVLIYAAALVIYAAVTGLSLPGAAGLSLLYGWFFGFWRALLLVSFGSTAGATIAFLLSRYLFRDMVQRRLGDRLGAFNRAWEREGAFYLFTLRLIAAVPFWMINLVMGLTPIRAWTFWWVSQLGMLPGTCVYVWAGSAVPDLQTLADKGIYAVVSPARLTQLLVAFAVLGLFPLVIKKVVDRLRPAGESAAASESVRS